MILSARGSTRSCVFNWGFAGPDRDAGQVFDSLLTVTLEEAGDESTVLTLVHERLDELHAAMPEVAAQVENGWISALDKPPAAVA